MSTDTKCIEFVKQIKDLREYGPFAKDLARDEVANAFEALLEIVVGLAPQQTMGAENLQAEVTDLRRQKTDLETALGATMTAWHKDKAALESQLAAARQSSDLVHDETVDLRTQLDATTKRAELAEATLESVRAAVAKPVEGKQDGRPKVGDAVSWSEMEDGALYFDTPCMVPFVGRYRGCWHWLSNDTGSNAVATLLAGFGSANPRPSLVHSNEGTLVARDLGSDPEAWRAAMREHLAKVGA